MCDFVLTNCVIHKYTDGIFGLLEFVAGKLSLFMALSVQSYALFDSIFSNMFNVCVESFFCCCLFLYLPLSSSLLEESLELELELEPDRLSSSSLSLEPLSGCFVVVVNADVVVELKLLLSRCRFNDVFFCVCVRRWYREGKI